MRTMTLDATEPATAGQLSNLPPEERWPETFPLLRDGKLELSAEEMDELHGLWPDYWPPASAVQPKDEETTTW